MAAMFEVNVTGDEAFIAALGRASLMADTVLVQTMREGFQTAFRISQVQVPFRFGPLKASGRVDGPRKNGVNWEVEISYGNTAVAYALYQHEGMRRDGSHRIKNYHNGKKGKYVEDPVNAVVPLLTPALVARVEQLFENGTLR